MQLFAEVIRRPGAFMARRCKSLKEFKSCQNHDNDTIMILTFPPEPEANGKYYLTTSNEDPYGKGYDGISCSKKKEEVNVTIDKTKVSNPRRLAKLKNITINMTRLKKTQAESQTQKEAEIDHSKSKRAELDTENEKKNKYRTVIEKRASVPHSRMAKMVRAAPNWIPFKKLQTESTTKKETVLEESKNNKFKSELEKKMQKIYSTLIKKHAHDRKRLAKLKNYIINFILDLNSYKYLKFTNHMAIKTVVKEFHETKMESETEEESDDEAKEGQSELDKLADQKSFEEDSSGFECNSCETEQP